MDLDIQLLWTEDVGPEALKEACERTFQYRNEHVWPPLPLQDMTADQARYDAALREVQVGGQRVLVESDFQAAQE